MGYPVQNNAPKITLNGQTLAVGAFDFPTPMGNLYVIGLFEKQSDGSWNQLHNVASYLNPNDLLNDVVAKGGKVKFLKWIIAQINAFLAALFGAPTPPTPPVEGEPTTDGEAKAFLVTSVNALTFTTVNGIPVLG